jgi:hypothetical protein
MNSGELNQKEDKTQPTCKRFEDKILLTINHRSCLPDIGNKDGVIVIEAN